MDIDQGTGLHQGTSIRHAGSTLHRSVETDHRRAGRTVARHAASALTIGLGAVAFLAACGDRQTGPRVVETRPAAAPVTPRPSPDGVTPPLPAGSLVPGVGADLPAASPVKGIEPAAPPTVEETRAAWREGVGHYESGDFENAALHLGVAAAGRPEDPYAQYLLGLALWKSGHLEEGEAALLRSAGLDDGFERTFVNLARVRLDRGDAPGALEAADRALTLKPGSAQALHQRGRALDALNRGDEARDTLRQARRADPANGYIANTLGYLLLRQGLTGEAVVELEAARESIPEVSYVRNNLGAAYERLGRIDEAMGEFRAAVEAGDPDGKAAGSLARLEPIQERRLARRLPDDAGPAASGVALAEGGADPETPNE